MQPYQGQSSRSYKHSHSEKHRQRAQGHCPGSSSCHHRSTSQTHPAPVSQMLSASRLQQNPWNRWCTRVTPAGTRADLTITWQLTQRSLLPPTKPLPSVAQTPPQAHPEAPVHSAGTQVCVWVSTLGIFSWPWSPPLGVIMNSVLSPSSQVKKHQRAMLQLSI